MNTRSVQLLIIIFNTLFINSDGRLHDKENTKTNKYINKRIINNFYETNKVNERLFQSAHLGPIKCVRVVRQTGYRYERPVVSFDLPSRGAGSTLPGPSPSSPNNYSPGPSTASPSKPTDYNYPAPVEITPQRSSSPTPSPPTQGSIGLSQGYQSNSGPSTNSLMYPMVSVNIQPNNVERPLQNAGDYSYSQPSSPQPQQPANNNPSYSYQQPSTPSALPTSPSSQKSYSFPQPTGSSGGGTSTPGPPYLPPFPGSTAQPSPPSYSYAQSSSQNPSPISSTPGPPYLPPKLSPNSPAPTSTSYQPSSAPNMVIVVPDQPQYSGIPDNTYLQPRTSSGIDVRASITPSSPSVNNYVPPARNAPPSLPPRPPSPTYLSQPPSSQAPVTISPSTMRSVENSYLAPSPEYRPSIGSSDPSKSYGAPDSEYRPSSAAPFSPSNSYGFPASDYGSPSTAAIPRPNPSNSYVPPKPTGFQRPTTSFPTSPSVSTPASTYLPPYK